MGLKAIVASLDGIAEGFRSLYKGHDGKFLLDVDGVDGYALEDVSGLKTALGKEREDRRTAQSALDGANAGLKAFEGLDPGKTRESLAQLVELLKIDPAKEADRLAQERVTAWTKTEGTKLQGEVETRDKKIESLSAALSREMIESKAVQAITTAKGRVKPLMPHILSRTRIREVDGAHVVEVLDEKGNPRIGAQAKPMTIDELVGELKADQDFAGTFDGTGHSGSGSQHSAGGGAGGGAPPTKSVDLIKAGLQRRAAGGR